MGSPKKEGNTATLLKAFISALEDNKVQVKYISLYDSNITPCLGCNVCQDIFDGYGCVTRDGMYEITDELIKSDCFIFATPIYIWNCTAPMKTMLDRLYGMGKQYGISHGPKFLKGKKYGIVATCGFEIEYAISFFEEGLNRFSGHLGIDYMGKLAIQDGIGDDTTKFKNENSKKMAVEYAKTIIATCIKH
jgi:multimeric flavodoxin WrbA